MSIPAGPTKRPPDAIGAATAHEGPAKRSLSASRPPLAGRPAPTGASVSCITSQDPLSASVVGPPVLRVAATTGQTLDRDMTPEPAPTGPSASLLHDMLNAANESTRLATSQRDNFRQQLDGACRRIDELEATMAQNAVKVSAFLGQSRLEADTLMQNASNTNLELGRKLTHAENEVGSLREQLASSEQRITEQHRQEAQGFAKTAHAEVHRANLRASAEQAAAEAASHALQTARAQIEEQHVLTNTLRTQLAEANVKYATAAAATSSATAGDIIRSLRDHQQRANEEMVGLTAKMHELNLKLISSQQEHAQATSRLQLQVDHATASMQRMSQDHEQATRRLRDDPDVARAECKDLRDELNAAPTHAALVESDREGMHTALQLQLDKSGQP